MGYYAQGDPGLFDWIGSAAKWVGGAAQTISNIPILGQALRYGVGGPVGGFVAGVGSAITGFERGGLPGGVAAFLEPAKMLPGIGGIASLGLDLLTQSGPPGPGQAYEEITGTTAPPYPSTRGYSTAAWEDYDPYEDDFGGGFTEQEPNLGYTAPAAAMTSPGLQYAPQPPDTAASLFRRALKF